MYKSREKFTFEIAPIKSGKNYNTVVWSHSRSIVTTQTVHQYRNASLPTLHYENIPFSSPNPYKFMVKGLFLGASIKLYNFSIIFLLWRRQSSSALADASLFVFVRKCWKKSWRFSFMYCSPRFACWIFLKIISITATTCDQAKEGPKKMFVDSWLLFINCCWKAKEMIFKPFKHLWALLKILSRWKRLKRINTMEFTYCTNYWKFIFLWFLILMKKILQNYVTN